MRRVRSKQIRKLAWAYYYRLSIEDKRKTTPMRVYRDFKECYARNKLLEVKTLPITYPKKEKGPKRLVVN